MCYPTSIESLEPRIAPATLLSPTTVSYQDIDGDGVVVKISKPLFTTTDLANKILTFSTGSVNNDGNASPQSLTLIDLRGIAAAERMDISISVNSKSAVGNGRADVGAIYAADVDGSAFQFSNNIDLGNVNIQGDLGMINVGDDLSSPALKSLTVHDFGVYHGPGGDQLLASSVQGPITTLHVTGDLVGLVHLYGVHGSSPTSFARLNNGSIGTLTIDGALKGGSGIGDSGQIFFNGTIGSATIGEITGSDGDSSGMLVSAGSSSAPSIIKDLHILGDILGGSGSGSGQVAATIINTIQIDGNVTGGGGINSALVQAHQIGSISIQGDVTGGAGNNSGNVQATESLGQVAIQGSIIGGGGSQSGLVYWAAGKRKSGQPTITVGGDLSGGEGSYTGILFGASTKSITIQGSVIGGSGNSSGLVQVQGAIGSASIGGNILGGTGVTSGAIVVTGALSTLAVANNVIGASSTESFDIFQSGFISANHIGVLTIGGSLVAGSKVVGDIADSGAIRSGSDIGRISIGGDFRGDETNAAVISAVGFKNLSIHANKNLAINALNVGGDMTRANILAGYGDAADASSQKGALGAEINADAQINSITIGGKLTASNIVAGVSAGADGFFGTADDALISSSSADLPRILGKIASVVIKGGIGSSNGTGEEAFGIVAQYVASVTIQDTAVGLIPSGQNDLAPGVALGSTTSTTATLDGKEFHVLEV